MANASVSFGIGMEDYREEITKCFFGSGLNNHDYIHVGGPNQSEALIKQNEISISVYVEGISLYWNDIELYRWVRNSPIVQCFFWGDGTFHMRQNKWEDLRVIHKTIVNNNIGTKCLYY